MRQSEIRELFRVSQIELRYRRKAKSTGEIQITSPETAHQIFRSAWDENKIDLQEQFSIMLMANDRSCLGLVNVATGTSSKCLVDPKLVFAAAITGNASCLILSHNHPSGNLKASKSDIAMTEQFRQIGRLLDIEVSDHFILSSQGYISMVQENVLSNVESPAPHLV